MENPIESVDEYVQTMALKGPESGKELVLLIR
jgi:hypothetical protein